MGFCSEAIPLALPFTIRKQWTTCVKLDIEILNFSWKRRSTSCFDQQKTQTFLSYGLSRSDRQMISFGRKSRMAGCGSLSLGKSPLAFSNSVFCGRICHLLRLSGFAKIVEGKGLAPRRFGPGNRKWLDVRFRARSSQRRPTRRRKNFGERSVTRTAAH